MAVYLGSNEVNLRGGQPMENGLPSGGLTGQMLAKSSNDDYVTAWTTVYDIPAGGSVGQVLAKSSDDDYALTWMSIESDPALPSGGLNGQVLAKSSNDDYAVAWSTLPPGEFVITVTQISTIGSGTFSMDRTIAQIKTAIGSGQHVVIYFKRTAYSQYSEPGEYKRFPYKRATYGYYEFENDFIDVQSTYTGLYSYLFKINISSGVISLTREHAYGVAAGNSNYIGKFLGAISGYGVPMLPEWQTIYQVPAEGSSGQVLQKNGNGSSDYGWADLTVPFVVTFTNNQGTITADKTINELLDALDAHQRPIGFYQPDNNSYAVYMLPNYTQFGGHYYFSGEINLGYNNIENIQIDLNGMNTYKQYRRITYNMNTDDSYATHGPSDTGPLRELFMESSAPPEVLPTALVYNDQSNSDGYTCYVASYISNAYNDNNEFEGKIEFIRHGVVNSGSEVRLCIQSFTLTHNLDTGNITYTSITTKYINFDA